jgi:hypothetical protein
MNQPTTPYFLVYASRSGSTYLGSLLDCYDDIGVSLESLFIYYLLNGPDRYSTKSEIDGALDYFYEDDRSREWDLDRDQLTLRLEKVLPLTPPELLQEVLEANFEEGKPSAKIYLFKGCSSRFMHRLVKRFPNTKVVFVYRDGRAVYASQKKSRVPYASRVHSTNPIITARGWVRWFQVIDDITANGARVMQVKYEDMIGEVEEVVPAVHRFLTGNTGPDTPVSFETKKYARRIPSAQSDIHQNVESPPLKSRIDGWRTELPDYEIKSFEKAAGPMLIAHGYEFSAKSRGAALLKNRLFDSKYRAELVFEALRAKFSRIFS